MIVPEAHKSIRYLILEKIEPNTLGVKVHVLKYLIVSASLHKFLNFGCTLESPGGTFKTTEAWFPLPRDSGFISLGTIPGLLKMLNKEPKQTKKNTKQQQRQQ